MNSDNTPPASDEAPVADETVAVAVAVAVAPEGADDTAVENPRIRWAAIVWGTVFAVVSGLGILTLGVPGGYADLVDRAFDITLPVIVAAAVAVFGAVILVLGIVGTLRRAQVRAGRGRS